MPSNPRPPRGSDLPGQSRFLWRVAPPLLRGVGRAFFSLKVEFEAERPRPPFVVAANHYSHLDPPLIASVLDVPVRFLALEDLFGANRLLDWLITGFGAIPTPRERPPIRAVRTALDLLVGGGVVGVFPEATRVSHWGTLPPKRGAAWLALRADVPLLPVAVIGTGHALGLDNKLHRAPIKVAVGAPLHATEGSQALIGRWAAWVTSQIETHSGSEVPGSPATGLPGW